MMYFYYIYCDFSLDPQFINKKKEPKEKTIVYINK